MVGASPTGGAARMLKARAAISTKCAPNDAAAIQVLRREEARRLAKRLRLVARSTIMVMVWDGAKKARKGVMGQ